MKMTKTKGSYDQYILNAVRSIYEQGNVGYKQQAMFTQAPTLHYEGASQLSTLLLRGSLATLLHRYWKKRVSLQKGSFLICRIWDCEEFKNLSPQIKESDVFLIESLILKLSYRRDFEKNCNFRESSNPFVELMFYLLDSQEKNLIPEKFRKKNTLLSLKYCHPTERLNSNLAKYLWIFPWIGEEIADYWKSLSYGDLPNVSSTIKAIMNLEGDNRKYIPILFFFKKAFGTQDLVDKHRAQIENNIKDLSLGEKQKLRDQVADSLQDLVKLEGTQQRIFGRPLIIRTPDEKLFLNFWGEEQISKSATLVHSYIDSLRNILG
jgi:hypothetical protein